MSPYPVALYEIGGPGHLSNEPPGEPIRNLVNEINYVALSLPE